MKATTVYQIPKTIICLLPICPLTALRKSITSVFEINVKNY